MLKMFSAALVICLVGWSRSGPFLNRRAQSRSPSSVADILRWFPKDTETVIVTHGPFQLVDNRAEPPRDFARQFQVLSLGPLPVLQNGRFDRQLVGQTVLLAVEASRRFRSPKRLGGMPYEGCHVIFFRPDFVDVREGLLRSLETHATAIDVIGGHRVMTFEDKWESDIWKIHLTFLEESVLLCSTDESFFRETLNRMDSKAPRQALPESLPEWKYVDQQAQTWAIRHYDKKSGAYDPSSPFSGHRATYSVPDSEAIGLVMSFDPGQTNEIKVNYLSPNADALRIAKEYWEHPGLCETSYPNQWLRRD